MPSKVNEQEVVSGWFTKLWARIKDFAFKKPDGKYPPPKTDYSHKKPDSEHPQSKNYPGQNGKKEQVLAIHYLQGRFVDEVSKACCVVET